MQKILYITILLFSCCTNSIFAGNSDNSTKKERNYIRQGNDAYEVNHYRDAEISYRKSLEINPTSEIGQYNLASSLMKQSGSAQADSPYNPIVQADSIFRSLASNAQNKKVVENSYYNLGNIAFDKQDYSQSIEMYKSALRINPDNDAARENLRLAQLKKQEQEQNRNKKDKNKDKNKEQNKEKENNKDQENKQNNQDNNLNKDNKDDKGEQNQAQQQQEQQNKKQDKQQSQGISDANAEKILKTMENEENATRRKVNEMKKKEDEKNASRRKITNQW